MGPNLAIFLAPHWGRKYIVRKAGRFLGKAFRTRCGMTQGDPSYPIIFNIVVDVVVRLVMEEVC